MPAVFSLPESAHDIHSLTLLRNHGLLGLDVSEAQVRRARRAYYGAVSYIDEKVGQLLGVLDATGLREGTLIVFTSDHGEMLGERGLWLKKNFYEPAMRVPMILNGAGVPIGKRSTTPVSLVDVLPTCLAAGRCDLSGPELLDGSDMLALAANDPAREVVGEILSEGTPAPAFMIRRGSLKYISCSAYPAMLFDLANDPHELTNVIEEPSYRSDAMAFQKDVAKRWDERRLSEQIRQSQQRRQFVVDAMSQGASVSWDYIPPPRDNWFRGKENYNDWAFEHLPTRGES